MECGTYGNTYHLVADEDFYKQEPVEQPKPIINWNEIPSVTSFTVINGADAL